MEDNKYNSNLGCDYVVKIIPCLLQSNLGNYP